MDSVDVQIYLSQIKTFFSENPDQLIKLIGDASPEDFYNEVYRVALENFEKGDDVQLTNNQMIQVLVDLNEKQKDSIKTIEVIVPYVQHKFGKIYLN